MKLLMFSVFDMAADMYLEPFFAVTIAAATRSFETACRREGHPFEEFPEDYVLYHVGEFEQGNGMIEKCEPHKVAMAASYSHVTPQLEVSSGS